eukprot:3423847-Rhodomonas_salina.1
MRQQQELVSGMMVYGKVALMGKRLGHDMQPDRKHKKKKWSLGPGGGGGGGRDSEREGGRGRARELKELEGQLEWRGQLWARELQGLPGQEQR